MNNSKNRVLLVIVTLAAMAILGIYFFSDSLKRDVPWIGSFLASHTGSNKVTYYQWTSSSGEMVISREKPVVGTNFITFEGTEDLIKNENIVDRELINKSNSYRAEVNAQNQKEPSSTSAKKVPSSSRYPFSAISKTKRCIKLSSQITDARNHQKDTSALKAKYANEC